MKENLNVDTRINASVVPLNNNIIQKYCYGDESDSCSVYGGLYAWNELMNYTTSSSSNPSGRQGICPPTWHIPSDPEWTQLVDFLGGPTEAGAAQKEDGYAHWTVPNSNAVNTSGFTALPGGGKDSGMGSYFDLSWQGYFWTSTADAPGLTEFSWIRYLTFGAADVYRLTYDKTSGFSVRCLKD